VAAPLATVLAAQLGTTPLLVAMGATTSPASVPANLLAVPVAGWVMVWGLTGGVVAAVAGGPVAALLHGPTAAMLWWIDRVAAVAASPRLPVLGATASVLAVAGAVLVAAGPSRRWRWLGAAGVAAVVVVGLVPPPAGEWSPVAGARVWRWGGATAAVVGGGADPGDLLDQLRRRRVRRLDVAVLTSDSGASTAQGEALRGALDVGVVLAPAGRVRGADDLVEGPLVVGGLRLEVRSEGGRWVVEWPRVG
jgi:hypothetical protein